MEFLFERGLGEILSNKHFQEALFMASPELAQEIFENPSNLPDHLKLVVWKYFNRMCFRSTPFGLFAGCGKINWGTNSSVVRSSGDINRRSRLDKEFFSLLVEELGIEKKLLFSLKLTLNNTLYRSGDYLRMIEPSVEDNAFQVIKFQQNELLKLLYEHFQDKTFVANDLVQLSTKLGLTKKAIRDYLLVLFADGFIKTELNVLIPTGSLLQRYIDVISKIKHPNKISWLFHLANLQNQLKGIDNSVDPGYEKYINFFGIAQACLPNYPAKKILQVDHTYPPKSGMLDARLKKSLLKGIEILKLIHFTNDKYSYLETFIILFQEKYEAREISLLTALDPEIGISYVPQNSFDSFLIKELGINQLPGKTGDQYSSSTNAYLLQSFYYAIAKGHTEIHLDPAKLVADNDTIKLAKTSSLFFRLAGNHIHIKNVGGSSGMNLFSRFTDVDHDIKQMADEIAEIDQLNSEIITAEVVHAPFRRTGNILPGHNPRQYEIPYISQSDPEQAIQIPLSDIFVSIEKGQLILKSKKLKRVIRPILSHAFNYQKASPIYRFFADVQFGRAINLQFDFPSLIKNQPFYPRVSYQNLVFSLATWFINWMDVKSSSTDLSQNIIQYLADNKIPPRFLITEGDNELLIDINHPYLFLLFLDIFKRHKRLRITEFLFDTNIPIITNENGKQLNHEFIAILINEDMEKPLLQKTQFPLTANHIIRSFSIGSEWLYFKIYTGTNSADDLLTKEILPVIQKLYKQKLIDQFFFIRYHDPNSHLRIRLKLKDPKFLSVVNELFGDCFSRLENDGLIWKIQVDTYVRELERYGNSMIETECYFSNDSDAILKLLLIEDVKFDPITRIATGIRLTNDLIQIFIKDIDGMIRYCKSMKESLKNDCKVDFQTEKKIKEMFENNGQRLSHFLINNARDKSENIFCNRSRRIMRSLIRLNNQYPQQYNEPSLDLLVPWVHMSVNRLFANDQKLYEYLIYNFLYKYYNRLKNKPVLEDNQIAII